MSAEVYQTLWTSVGGLQIRARRSIETPLAQTPVILIPGLGVSADYMLPTLIALAGDFIVWAPELPGFGKSDKPSHVLSIPELADVVARWAAVTNIGGAVFLGNSLGCQVIIDLAVRYPSLVEAAILVGPT